MTLRAQTGSENGDISALLGKMVFEILAAGKIVEVIDNEK
jgi:hypothetical protein